MSFFSKPHMHYNILHFMDLSAHVKSHNYTVYYRYAVVISYDTFYATLQSPIIKESIPKVPRPSASISLRSPSPSFTTIQRYSTPGSPTVIPSTGIVYTTSLSHNNTRSPSPSFTTIQRYSTPGSPTVIPSTGIVYTTSLSHNNTRSPSPSFTTIQRYSTPGSPTVIPSTGIVYTTSLSHNNTGTSVVLFETPPSKLGVDPGIGMERENKSNTFANEATQGTATLNLQSLFIKESIPNAVHPSASISLRSTGHTLFPTFTAIQRYSTSADSSTVIPSTGIAYATSLNHNNTSVMLFETPPSKVGVDPEIGVERENESVETFANEATRRATPSIQTPPPSDDVGGVVKPPVQTTFQSLQFVLMPTSSTTFAADAYTSICM